MVNGSALGDGDDVRYVGIMRDLRCCARKIFGTILNGQRAPEAGAGSDETF